MTTVVAFFFGLLCGAVITVIVFVAKIGKDYNDFYE